MRHRITWHDGPLLEAQDIRWALFHRAGRAGVPNGIRTRVAAVKGRCPRPLDDRDAVAAGGAHLRCALGPRASGAAHGRGAAGQGLTRTVREMTLASSRVPLETNSLAFRSAVS